MRRRGYRLHTGGTDDWGGDRPKQQKHMADVNKSTWSKKTREGKQGRNRERQQKTGCCMNYVIFK